MVLYQRRGSLYDWVWMGVARANCWSLTYVSLNLNQIWLTSLILAHVRPPHLTIYNRLCNSDNIQRKLAL